MCKATASIHRVATTIMPRHDLEHPSAIVCDEDVQVSQTRMQNCVTGTVQTCMKMYTSTLKTATTPTGHNSYVAHNGKLSLPPSVCHHLIAPPMRDSMCFELHTVAMMARTCST